MSIPSDRIAADHECCNLAIIIEIIQERLGVSPRLAEAMALGALATKDGAAEQARAGGWLR